MNAADIQSLCRSIAPADFGGHPCYVALSSELPAELRIPQTMFGMTGRAYDLSLKAWLADCGRWQGRGFAFTIGDTAIAETAASMAGPDNAFADLYARLQTLAIVCHELSHGLTVGLEFNPAPDTASDYITDAYQSAIACWSPDAYDDAAKESRPPWRVTGDHGAGFIRALCHVLYRAERLLGEQIPSALAFFHEGYGLSHLKRYRQSLLAETVAQQATPFYQLSSIRPPQSFIDVWRDDVRRWFNATPDASVDHVVESMSPFIGIAG